MGRRLDERLTLKLDPDQRRWLTHQVLPELHQRHDRLIDIPSVNSLDWLGGSLQLLHWRNESWVRWQDMPGVLMETPSRRPRNLWRRLSGWAQAW